ncbi:MAG: C-terminal binding protein [Candidatus Bathyarchaeia archaeon]
MRFKVHITDFLQPPPDVEEEVLRGIASVRLHRAKNEDALGSEIDDADALIAWHTIEITEKTISRLKACRGIVRCGVGIENVDLEAAGKRSIYVCNVPDYGVDEVSDHTIAMLLMLHRRMTVYDQSVRSGVWDFKVGKPIRRLRGQTLGIVGLGRMGTATALKAKVLGLRVVEYDPYIPRGIEKSLGVESVDFQTLLEISDIVSMHVPLTEETYHMIGVEELRRMKPSAILINTSRGPVVDNHALYLALKEGVIAGAGLDVLEQEPPSPGTPLIQLPNVVLTPHSAFYSEDAFKELRLKGAQEVARILRGQKPLNPVNMQFYRES